MSTMRRSSMAIAAGILLMSWQPALAVLDHDGTPWTYMADGSTYPGNGNAPGTNETIDGDGTKINGMAYYGGGADHNLDNPADEWDLDTPSPGIISYDTNTSGWGFFSRVTGLSEGGTSGGTEWTHNTGFTAEWRMGSHYPSNGSGHIRVEVQTGPVSGQAYIFKLDVAQDPTVGDGFHQVVDTNENTAIPVPYDTRDGSLHIYRMVLDPVVGGPATVDADLYIDNVLTDQLLGISNVTNARFDFGRLNGGSYLGGGNPFDADWDFFRFHPGATPAVIPEPSVAGLLFGAGLLLWQRRRR